MLSPHLRSILGALALGTMTCCAVAAEEDGLASLSMRLDPTSPDEVYAMDRLAALIGKSGDAPAKELRVINTGSEYVVYGDLFRTGEEYALLALTRPEEQPSIVALALNTESGWRIQSRWDIPATWRPKEWNLSSYKPNDRPFELLDLSGDGVPEVLIAGELHNYFQAYYLLHFDETRGLCLVGAAMRKPQRAGEYTRLEDNSGRRAIWQEWGFYKWEGGKLILAASWYDETPYNNPEEPFQQAEVYSNGKLLETFRITMDLDESLSDRESAYQITRDGLAYARVLFTWPRPFDELGGIDSHSISMAWLFAKLTGLPRDLYPISDDQKPVPDIKGQAEVKVTGTPEAMQRLR